MKNLIYSVFLLSFSTAYSQKMSKIVQTNENNRTFRYEKSSIYARGLFWENDRLFMSNSDGAVYYFNTKTRYIFGIQIKAVIYPLLLLRKLIIK